MSTRMTAKAAPQVFLSFSTSDQDLAHDVSANLRRSGLDVVGSDEVTPAGAYDDELRDALQGSDAVVVVLSEVARRRDLPASVLFEIGAAVGAGKPIFVLLDRMTDKLPFNVPHLNILPVNRAEEIAQRLTSGHA